MKKSLWLLFALISSVSAFAASGTVMADTATGALRAPANFIAGNAAAIQAVAQTPWAADVNANAKGLTNVASIQSGSTNVFILTMGDRSPSQAGYHQVQMAIPTNSITTNYTIVPADQAFAGPVAYAVTGAATNPVVRPVSASSYLAPPFTAFTDGATITLTLDATKAVQNFAGMIAGNRTLAFSGLAGGMSGTLIVKQDSTGSRTLALPASSKVISGGSGAVTLTTTANAIDILTWTTDGTNTYWNLGKNYN
jgi:hypothetical protein